MMKRLSQLLGAMPAVKRMVGDSRGAIAVPAAVAAPFFLVMVGMAVEYQHWLGIRSDYQDVADAAAYSIALDALYGANDDQIEATLGQLSARSDGSALPITYNWPPAYGPFEGREGFIQAEVKGLAPRYLTKIMFSGDYDIKADAVAQYSGGELSKEACIMALSADAHAAVEVAGSAQLELSVCLMVSNSLSEASMRMASTASLLDVACVSLAGGADISSSATIISTLTDPNLLTSFANIRLHDCEEIKTQQAAASDPYQHLKSVTRELVASTTNCMGGGIFHNEPLPSPTVNSTGLAVQCLTGNVSLKGEVELDPGIYIIKRGDLVFNANSVVRGENVTFIMAEDAELTINGGAELELTAPTSGATQGMAFMSDGFEDGTAATHKFNGNAMTSVDGVVYMPTDDLVVTGSSVVSRSCIQFIADTVKVTGNFDLSIGCLPSNRAPRYNGKVALVG